MAKDRDRQNRQTAGSIVKVLFGASLAISAKGSPVSRELEEKIFLPTPHHATAATVCFLVAQIFAREGYGERRGSIFGAQCFKN
jgi:hypothetical protein